MQDDAADLRGQDSHCLYEGERSRLNPVLLGALIFCNMMRHDGVYGELENGDSGGSQCS